MLQCHYNVQDIICQVRECGQTPELKDCSLSLTTYTGESVKILGATDVIVQHGNQVRELPVVVVSTDGPNLLGRGWIKELDICWSMVNQVTTVNDTSGSVDQT